MFVNVGRNRKHCGHEHQTHTEAEKCLLEKQKECRKKGKLCDWVVTECDDLEQLLDDLQYY